MIALLVVVFFAAIYAVNSVGMKWFRNTKPLYENTLSIYDAFKARLNGVSERAFILKCSIKYTLVFAICLAGFASFVNAQWLAILLALVLYVIYTFISILFVFVKIQKRIQNNENLGKSEIEQQLDMVLDILFTSFPLGCFSIHRYLKRSKNLNNRI